MSLRTFSSAVGTARLERAIVTAETHTSAEVVIAVRRAASPHHRTTLVVATLVTLLGFSVWWFSPTHYDVRLLPLELLVTFAVGAFVVHSVDPLRRVLTPANIRRAELDREAREAFDSLGIANTKSRIGILVVAGLFERDVAIIADEGLDYSSLRERAIPIERTLASSVASGDVEAFANAIEALGILLGETNPCSPDDENELADGIR